MTSKEAYTLGWIYGKLTSVLTEEEYIEFDRTGIKLCNAAKHPLENISMLHEYVIQKHKINNVFDDIMNAMTNINISNISTNSLLPALQGNWWIGYYHAKSGNKLPSFDDIGYDLKEKRKKKGLTQSELAQALNVDQSVISKWENGSVFINEEQLKKIKSILDEAE